MDKVKLTREQVDALNKALDFYGHAKTLVYMHSDMIRRNAKWTVWPVLNGLSTGDLYDALNYGYEVDEQSSHQIRVEIGMEVRMIDGIHKGCTFYVSTIGEGYFLVDAFGTECICAWSYQNKVWEFADIDDRTNLAPHDYSSMIDIALMTGDKAWFDELHAKMREGATQ